MKVEVRKRGGTRLQKAEHVEQESYPSIRNSSNEVGLSNLSLTKQLDQSLLVPLVSECPHELLRCQ